MTPPFVIRAPWWVADIPAVVTECLPGVGWRMVWWQTSAARVDGCTVNFVEVGAHRTASYAPIAGADVQKVLAQLKRLCLSTHAQPEAVWQIHGISPFTTKELGIMVEKLKGKAKVEASEDAPVGAGGKLAKAAKPAKAPKAVPEAKPVGKGGKVKEDAKALKVGNKEAKAKGKAKGDTPALAAAREGRAAANSAKGDALKAKKIKLLVKPKDSGLRGGRLAKLEAAAKAKTVADILGTTVTDENGKDHVIDMGAINGMAKREHIALA